MLCKDIMRRPVESVGIDETVQVAAQRMRDANIGMLPVRDSDGRAVGVVTDRDITVRACAPGKSPSDTLVRDVFTGVVVACHETDELARAETLMEEHHTSRVLVLDDHDELRGVISLSDVATYDQVHAGQTLRNVAEREVLSERGVRR